jgi:stress response protein YsnF
LREERPVVEKEAVPAERVRLAKESIPGEETVSGEVRKECIETEGDPAPGR